MICMMWSVIMWYVMMWVVLWWCGGYVTAVAHGASGWLAAGAKCFDGKL